MKFGTDKRDGHHYVKQESGARDDSDSPITFADSFVDKFEESEKEDFAKEKIQRLAQQDDLEIIDEIKEEQKKAESDVKHADTEKEINSIKEKNRSLFLNDINHIIEGNLSNAEKADGLQSFLDSDNYFTNNDIQHIKDEIKYFRQEAKEDMLDEKLELKTMSAEQRRQSRLQRQKDRTSRIRDAKSEVRMGFRRDVQFPRNSRQINVNNVSGRSTGKVQNKLDRDSALRLSAFLTRVI